MTTVKPHRLNVIGDFYVADDCCTACDVPEAEAQWDGADASAE